MRGKGKSQYISRHIDFIVRLFDVNEWYVGEGKLEPSIVGCPLNSDKGDRRKVDMTVTENEPLRTGSTIVCNVTMDSILDKTQYSGSCNVVLRIMKDGGKQKV